MSHVRMLRQFLSGYGLLIVAGSVLLLLPTTTVSSGGLSWFDALFTAVSAVCLVGLTIIDTATYFTWFGQVVLLLLIQLGALHYLFFALRMVRRHRHPTTMPGSEKTASRTLLRQIVGTTLLIEVGAFLLIFYTAGNYEAEEIGHNLFTSAFHAVSAFCNAGFSMLDDNLYSVHRAYVLHLVILAAYVLGGLGIDTLYDLFSRKRLRQRLANPAIDWRVGTKVSVNSAIMLLAVGTLAFYRLEQNNTLTDLNLTEKLVASLFQSATARTAGFYTVDIPQLTGTTLLLLIALMFIGGGAGSTAGGIHTATLFRLFTTQQDGRQRDAGRRRLSIAQWVVAYALVVNTGGVLLLCCTEADRAIVSLVFEQVSAFSSVGLSHATTATLSSGGQVVILLSMLLGRVGILTLIMILIQRRNARERIRRTSS